MQNSQNRNRLIDIGNKLLVTRGERVGCKSEIGEAGTKFEKVQKLCVFLHTYKINKIM